MAAKVNPKDETKDLGFGVRKDGQPKGKPGRRPGVPPARPRAAGGDAVAPAAVAVEPGEPRRSNGTPVPTIVRKMIAAIDDRRFVRDRIEKALGLSTYKFHAWEVISGSPSVEQAIRIANHMDVSLEYLIDDTIPVQTPAPGRDNGPTARLANSLALQGLSLDQAEQYVMPLATAVASGIAPAELFRIILSAARDRDTFLKGQPRQPRLTGPAATLTDITTEGEIRAAQQASDDDRRRNGGPKPRTAG